MITSRTLRGDDESDAGDAGTPVNMGEFTAKVKQMQGILGVTQTGEMDDATRAAIKSLQEARGLPATGSLDQETLAALAALGADIAYLDSWPAKLRFFWMSYKWAIIGGGAAVVGGVLYWRSRKTKRR